MKGSDTILITKANGELVSFDRDKLHISLLRSGAKEERVQKIVSTIEQELVEGMPTQVIYKRAFGLLKASSKAHASRYKVKDALRKLCVTGHPFEHFIGKLLEKQGFEVQVSVVVPGKCVKHEVDVFALRKGLHYMVECKSHNVKDGKCDVKNSLYVHARFRDLEAYWKNQPGHETRLHQGWLVTNMRFTTDAIDYGTCAGLRLLSWDFPIGEALRDLIAEYHHYPITSIGLLSRSETKVLGENGIVIVDDLVNDHTSLELIKTSATRSERIVTQAKMLMEE